MGGLTLGRPRPLQIDDELDGFSSGEELIDRWIATRARHAREAGIAVVYVSFCGERLAGFIP